MNRVVYIYVYYHLFLIPTESVRFHRITYNISSILCTAIFTMFCVSCMNCLDILFYWSGDETARVCDFQSIPTHPDFEADKVLTLGL